MTSESYAREESWTPLPPTSRKWENSSDPVPLQYPVTPIPKKEEPAQDLNENVYGLEPQFERDPPQPKLSPDERPEAPRLREHHIWGMRPDESQ